MTGRRGRRRKKLLDDFKETRGYWKFKQEALNHTCGKLPLKRLWTYRKTDHEKNETRSSIRIETLFFSSLLVDLSVRSFFYSKNTLDSQNSKHYLFQITCK